MFIGRSYAEAEGPVLWQHDSKRQLIGKDIALTRQTFVGKVTSLLFNMLSRLLMEKAMAPLQYFFLENPMDGGAW